MKVYFAPPLYCYFGLYENFTLKKVTHLKLVYTYCCDRISPVLSYKVHLESLICSQISQIIRFFASKILIYKSNNAFVAPTSCEICYLRHNYNRYKQRSTHDPHILQNIIVIQPAVLLNTISYLKVAYNIEI